MMNRIDEAMQQFNLPADWPESPIKPASEAEILLFEQEIGHPLPADYRYFLKTYVGIPFFGIGFPIPDETENGETHAYVASMFGILADDSRDIFWRYRADQPYIPAELITIGDCENGYICLAVFGEKTGSVYFHNSREGGDDYESMYWLTGSFKEFIYKLVLAPDINE